MNGYDLYCYCRGLMGWNAPSVKSYTDSKEFGFYELLAKNFIENKHLNVEDIYNLIKVKYNKDPHTFNPYELLEDEVYEEFKKWRDTLSTKQLYFQAVTKSFKFIENYCINKNVSFEKYILTCAKKHIREEKIDYAVVSYLKLVDKSKLNKIEKIVLKKYLSQYNIIKYRLCNPELSTLLSHLYQEMKTLLQQMLLWEEPVNQSI